MSVLMIVNLLTVTAQLEYHRAQFWDHCWDHCCSLYMNDLPDVCHTVHVQMYADDVVVVSHGKNATEATLSLTCVLTKIQDWLLDSRLLVNTKNAYEVR